MIRKKPCVKITLTETKPSIFSSKAGGLGYIPHDGDFPRDTNGNQLRLLAQIDCARVGFAPFPESGLLQFWILNDDMYGLDFDHPTKQNAFRVIYYPETDATVTESEIRSKFVKNAFDDEDYYHPVSGEYGMLFDSGESSCLEDYYEASEEEQEEYDQQTEHIHHQIGGYPYFTQNDPRDDDSPYDFVLFQLDSEFWNHHEKVLWGDCGVANFFINAEKLKKLDFTDILYNWDCC